MSVLSISRNFSEVAQMVNMEVDVSLAAVATAGWLALPAVIADIEALNSGIWSWQPSDLVYCWSSLDVDGALFLVDLTTNSLTLYSTAGNGAVTLPVVADDFVVFDGVLGALKDLGFSASDPTKTKVVMAGSPVVVNHIAKFIDTAGTVDDTAGAAINSGNIQAGLSGTAGTLISFPAAVTSGSLILAAVTNASGNFSTTISNAAAIGQSQVISIPDSGSATAAFVLTASAGTQSLTGNLTVAGALTSTAGNITSGSAGDAGTFIAFPGTAGNGTLILAAVNAGGAFNTTISNGAMGQSTVYTIPDVGAATGSFLVTGTAFDNVKSVQAAVVAGGAASNVVVDAFCTAGSVVLASWVTQTNPTPILTITPGAGSFTVVSTVDPGASTLSYIILK